MREYETTLIIQPEISDEGTQAILEKVDGVLEKQNAIRLMCDDLGKRKLAYEIQKFHKGHYFLLSYLSDGSVVPELERSLRLEESVLRFLTIRSSDHVEDVEARREEARLLEIEQEKRAAEKATREAEEAKARAEIEEATAKERAEAAAAAAEAAEKREDAAVEVPAEEREGTAVEVSAEEREGTAVEASAEEGGAAVAAASEKGEDVAAEASSDDGQEAANPDEADAGEEGEKS